MRILLHSMLLLAAVGASSPRAQAQVLGADFAPHYTVLDLNPPPGVPWGYGGMTFKAGSPNTLLIIGGAETPGAGIYEIDVTRDGSGHLDGWSGSATLFATTPYATGGLIYAPNGVLLYTTYDDTGVLDNLLGQIKPGSTVADKLFDLDGLVCPSTGGIALTPAGFNNPGSFKITSYDCDNWYDADLVDDGTGQGLFDVTNASGMPLPVQGGATGIEHVDTTHPAFSAQSVLTMDWYNFEVSAYELDANGDPITGTRRVFLEATVPFAYLGSTTDQLTGDWLFGDSGTGNHVFVIKGNSGGPIGTNYCGPAVPNTTGNPGVMSASGSNVAADNDLTISADQLPDGEFAYFIASRTQGLIVGPGGSMGDLCVIGNIARFNRAGEVGAVSGGSFSLLLPLGDFPEPPTLGVTVLAGDTWNFQCWHRDYIQGQGATSNFTDALSIQFN